MIRPVNAIVLISFFSLATLAFAQSDVHLVDSPAKSLFHRSAWAHGYIHGYEAGFHQGNLDLHMARRPQDPHEVKEYKKSGHCYRPDFGNRHEFGKGYGSGFEVGYLDGWAGKEFRAASEANRLSSFVDDGNQDDKQSGHLDTYLDSGYLQGRRSGLSDARAKVEFRDGDSQCPDSAKTPQFCRAYQAGYKWGYSDGYSNQRPDLSTQRASK